MWLNLPSVICCAVVRKCNEIAHASVCVSALIFSKREREERLLFLLILIGVNHLKVHVFRLASSALSLSSLFLLTLIYPAIVLGAESQEHVAQSVIHQCCAQDFKQGRGSLCAVSNTIYTSSYQYQWYKHQQPGEGGYLPVDKH